MPPGPADTLPSVIPAATKAMRSSHPPPPSHRLAFRTLVPITCTFLTSGEVSPSRAPVREGPRPRWWQGGPATSPGARCRRTDPRAARCRPLPGELAVRSSRGAVSPLNRTGGRLCLRGGARAVARRLLLSSPGPPLPAPQKPPGESRQDRGRGRASPGRGEWPQRGAVSPQRHPEL